MPSIGPILVADLMPKVEWSLLELLRSLTAEDWERQTVAPRWKVKDVAAHLLDTQLRKLSMVRDSYAAETPNIQSPADLATFINRLNDEGVRIYRRLSPAVLISLLEVASRESCDFHLSLNPFAPAAFSVSWAGELQSLNWFDNARELTERWHHQQQIRLATGRPGIVTPELYHPVLDCFMRALPHRFRDVAAAPGTMLAVEVSGDSGGTWFLLRTDERWMLSEISTVPLTGRVVIPEEFAWRIFTKGLHRDAVEQVVRIEGDRDLAHHVLDMTAIVG